MKEIELIFRDPTLPFYHDTFKIHRGDCVAVFSSCEIPKFKWAAYIAKFNACINRNFVAACVDCVIHLYPNHQATEQNRLYVPVIYLCLTVWITPLIVTGQLLLNAPYVGFSTSNTRPGNNHTSGDISIFIYMISSESLADSEDSYDICDEVAHRQCDGS